MPKASLSIEIPDDAWVSDVSKSYPDAVFRVLSAFASEGRGVGIVEVEADGRIEEITDEISEHDAIAEIQLLWSEGNEALVEFETGKPMMLLAARRSGIPVRMPFEIRDGTGNWELTTSRERLSELDSVFDTMGISYELEYVHEVRSEEFLTDKQRNVMETALYMGYYDTPRESSLSEVAEEIGIAKSTCSEILHRAEEKIVKEFFG
ncbi:helix-turn-helix domain-containing protein [Haladaptatus sp. F3-133]|uniref:Helix-turn-helix domain-containing protein n=1 Tax=Halorutilus salinus TaxID=2487751 RepID=A0A9Q4GHC2_9EURY|nr:helix-turn-helix domain-containing protein [Halorutilus salinus]MCX2819697.1 helix-turn-helix domain-containing protein [Halorutilus salinus]